MRNYKPAAQLYILLVISAGVVLAGFELPRINPADGLILTALCGLASAAQVFKVQGATKQSMFHISWAVFGFTYVLLGAPAALAVIIVAHSVEWAWHRYPWFVQLFNLGSFTVVVCAANWLQTTTISLAGDEPWAASRWRDTGSWRLRAAHGNVPHSPFVRLLARDDAPSRRGPRQRPGRATWPP